MDITSPLTRLLPILITLALATAIEAIAPLRRQLRWVHGRVLTNLALMAITLALGIALNTALAVGSAYVAQRGLGAFQVLELGAVPSFALSLLALDLSAYAVHRLMHQTPVLWRLHLVHHIDPAVDATTALRQHPLEGVLRFAFIAATAWTLGASPAAIAVYRLLGALNSVLEHANIRVPRSLDRVLVKFWVTPDMHKVHHSRARAETDSNYANLFSFFDRLFGTYTTSSRGPSVSYGIDGYDRADQHSIGAVLWLPFRRQIRPAGAEHAAAQSGTRPERALSNSVQGE
jgi:sterol desaturase/sphingolipid hydroxylase (fatty acid hydroxylase superfamily)